MNSRLGPGGRGFDAAYTGLPPWDIGRPQQAYVELVQTGKIHGSVLDVGCGTGEHALYLAQHGHEVWGIDSSPTAIQKAQQKAAARGIAVTFGQEWRVKQIRATRFETTSGQGAEAWLASISRV